MGIWIPLFQSLVWPVFLLIIIILFRKELKKILDAFNEAVKKRLIRLWSKYIKMDFIHPADEFLGIEEVMDHDNNFDLYNDVKRLKLPATRIEIIRQIAKQQNIDEASAREHLSKLMEAGLIYEVYQDTSVTPPT